MKLLMSLLLMLALTACQTTKVTYLNTKELQTNYPRLLAFNFQTEDGLKAHHQHLKDELEPKIHSALQQRGFQIVPPTRLYEIHSSLLAAETRLYDPVTGQRDEVRAREIWLQALQQSKTELNIDGFVLYGITISSAYFSNNLRSMYVAKWNGMEEQALVDGVGATKVLGSFFVDTKGTLPGTSVFIQFENEFSKSISTGAGGIELLAQFNNDKEVVYKDNNSLFQDSEQLNAALQRALSQIDNYKGTR